MTNNNEYIEGLIAKELLDGRETATVKIYHQSGFSKSETPNSAVLLFAIMAIKKQVPAKITIRRYDNEGKILNGDCPVCGQVSPHSDYCLECGQKLDWSSDKE